MLHAHQLSLTQRFGPGFLHNGQCLLLGRHYAQSPHIYFSLNPGFARDGSPLDLSSKGDFNVPFSSSKEMKRHYVYLQNCERFLAHHPHLETWMNAGVTSAFLVPWRTRNVSELYALNHRSQGQIFAAARDLTRLIISHHTTSNPTARFLFVAGKSAIQLLNDLHVPDQPIQVDRYFGPGGTYQWSRSEILVEGTPLTVLQLPHFSRANSPAKLQALGNWLTAELKCMER